MDLNRLTFLMYHQVLTTFLLEKQNFWCFIHFPWFSYFVQDGTVLIHTVRRGHYVRTLRPPCSPGASLTVHQMALSDVGQIVLYCTQHFIGKSAKDVRLLVFLALIFSSRMITVNKKISLFGSYRQSVENIIAYFLFFL